jgi:RNA polymerase sigma factor (sigma-70 family)
MRKKSRAFRPDASARSEDLLARRFLAKEARTVAEIRRMVARIVRFHGYGVPPGDRDDVVQETLLQIWEAVRKPTFDSSRSFGSFVQTVAARRCIDRMRTHKTTVPLNPGLPHSTTGPLGNLMQKERVDLVREVFDRLKEACRELIRLHITEKKTYGQIAERLGRTEGALRVQMHQCIREARTILDRIVEAKDVDRGRAPKA